MIRLNRYRCKIAPVVAATRFDDAGNLPKYIHGVKGFFVLETAPRKYTPINVGDFVLFHKDGTREAVNYELFTKLYERVFDIDIDDVSDEYRPTDDEVQ